jgi:hypothetical protein
LKTINNHKHISLKLLVGLSILILIGILIFGLNPRHNFTNNFKWITPGPGIHFGKYSIAYTAPFSEPLKKDISDPNGFSIEIALKPSSFHEEGFNFIFELHNGTDRNQLLMGQWRSWLILMNGDDYDHKRRTKRIAVNTTSSPPSTLFVTIVTGKDGTEIYVDGRLAHTIKDLTLFIPDGDKTRLIIGNSVHGKHSWAGDVYGLAFYGYTLSAKAAALDFNRWSNRQSFSFAKNNRPFLLYLFDEKGGHEALDHSGENHHLKIPSRMQVISKDILSLPWKGFKLDRNFIQDVVLNLVGFIPFGFVLSATFVKQGGRFKKHNILITTVLCFIVSLIIEIAQAWMPSRSSQMLDLALNTLGGFSGAILFKMISVVQDKQHDC